MTTKEAWAELLAEHGIVCSTCGGPANWWVRDLIEIPGDGRHRNWEGSKMRFGCDQHPVEPVQYLLDGTIEK